MQHNLILTCSRISGLDKFSLWIDRYHYKHLKTHHHNPPPIIFSLNVSFKPLIYKEFKVVIIISVLDCQSSTLVN